MRIKNGAVNQMTWRDLGVVTRYKKPPKLRRLNLVQMFKLSGTLFEMELLEWVMACATPQHDFQWSFPREMPEDRRGEILFSFRKLPTFSCPF
ncbi:hypothetical protein LINPERPRIM_LOCUS13977, partial [Linum perenne]